MTEATIANEEAISVNSWLSIPMILVYANAIVGLATFEYFYYSVRRHNDPYYEKLHEQYPSFRRLDAKGWARWKFWPGAMTILIPRVIFVFGMLTMAGIGCLILCIGHKKDEPFGPIRARLLRWNT